jgi:hypothetical protein
MEVSREDAERLEGLLPQALSAVEAALRRGPEAVGRALVCDPDRAVAQARSRLRSERLRALTAVQVLRRRSCLATGALAGGGVRVRQACPAQHLGP